MAQPGPARTHTARFTAGLQSNSRRRGQAAPTPCAHAAPAMRPPKRADRPVLARLLVLAFFLGVVLLFGLTNFSFLAGVLAGGRPAAAAGLARRGGGEFGGGGARSLLDPSTDAVVPDLQELQEEAGAGQFIAGLQLKQQAEPRAAAAGAAEDGGRRGRTLVVYVYNAADIEHQKNFDFFLRWGVQAGDGVTYKVVITEGKGVLVSRGRQSGRRAPRCAGMRATCGAALG